MTRRRTCQSLLSSPSPAPSRTPAQHDPAIRPHRPTRTTVPSATSSSMPFRLSHFLRITTGSAAVLLAVLPASSVVRPAPTRTNVASGGVVAKELSPKAVEAARLKADVRRELTERGGGTYISEMLAERDSALARWHDLNGVPLKVWI